MLIKVTCDISRQHELSHVPYSLYVLAIMRVQYRTTPTTGPPSPPLLRTTLKIAMSGNYLHHYHLSRLLIATGDAIPIYAHDHVWTNSTVTSKAERWQVRLIYSNTMDEILNLKIKRL